MALVVAGVDQEVAVRISSGSTGTPGGLQRGPVAVDPRPAAQHVGRPADHADPAVAQLQQVPGGGQAAVPVGGADRGDAGAGSPSGSTTTNGSDAGAELAWTPGESREADDRPRRRSGGRRAAPASRGPGPAWVCRTEITTLAPASRAAVSAPRTISIAHGRLDLGEDQVDQARPGCRPGWCAADSRACAAAARRGGGSPGPPRDGR